MALQFVARPFFQPETEELRFLPEGPRSLQNYPAGASKLGWVAIQHGAGRTEGSVNILDLTSLSNTSLPLRGRPGFFAETTQPGIVLVGLERELAYFNLMTGVLGETVAQIEADPSVIINDGLAVEGGVLFGAKHVDFKLPLAGLYFFDFATLQVHTILDKQTCSNGKYLRRDSQGATLIDIDSEPRTISRYRLDAKLERVLESCLIKPPESLPAVPDGLRPAPAHDGEPEGTNIIIAFYNPENVSHGVAHQIRVCDGEVVCEWIIPGSPRVTCPEFVKIGGEVKLLFTTAVEGMPADQREHTPGAGCLFIADTAFEALPAPPPLLPV